MNWHVLGWDRVLLCCFRLSLKNRATRLQCKWIEKDVSKKCGLFSYRSVFFFRVLIQCNRVHCTLIFKFSVNWTRMKRPFICRFTKQKRENCSYITSPKHNSRYSFGWINRERKKKKIYTSKYSGGLMRIWHAHCAFTTNCRQSSPCRTRTHTTKLNTKIQTHSIENAIRANVNQNSSSA